MARFLYADAPGLTPAPMGLVQARSAAPRAQERTVQWTPVVARIPPTGVEAGTLLGVGARSAGGLALEGATVLVRRGGRLEVRAARDGVPTLVSEGITVVPGHELEGNVDREVGNRSVRGSLRIGGHIAVGREMSATGPMRVEGNIDRSHVRAGGELHVEGRADGAILTGGAHSALRAQLQGPLKDVGPEIDELLELAGQLLNASVMRGGGSPTPLAIRALCARRFDTLEERLAEARKRIAAARKVWPWLCAGLAAEVNAAHLAIAEPHESPDPLAALASAAGFIAAAVPSQKPVNPVGVRITSARNCSITTDGPVRLTGAGASDCDMEIGGDLIAMGSGGVIRSGQARVGGRVRARELAARDGAPLRIVLDEAASADDVLRADVVNAGVEVAVGLHTLRFERRETDVRVGITGGRPVLETV